MTAFIELFIENLEKNVWQNIYYCFVTHLCKYNLVIQGLSKDQESVKSYCET